MSHARINDIEVLRAVAVLAVLIHHAKDNLFTWQSPWLDYLNVYFGGWFGVDLFFAVSGFVIARTLLPQLRNVQDTQTAFRTTISFWIRRAWRLLPSAWLWLGIVFIASIVFRESGIWGSPKANLEATVAGVLNIANLRFLDTFMRTEYGTSFVYWSLSLEEQFYLILPLLIIVSRKFLVPVLLVIALYQLVQERTLTMMAFRCDGLLLGVLLAIWSQHSTYSISRPFFLEKSPLKATIPFAIIVLFLGLLGSDVLRIAPLRTSWITLLCIILVWIASYNADVLVPKLIRPLMLWIGARSYAIYLIHVPAFFLTREIWDRIYPQYAADNNFVLAYICTASLLIIILSELNYRLVEMPFRKRGAIIANSFIGKTTTTSG